VVHVAEVGLSVAVRERRRVFAEKSLRDWYAYLPESDRGAASLRVEAGEPFAVLLAQSRERDVGISASSANPAVAQRPHQRRFAGHPIDGSGGSERVVKSR
jgi:hypothetical protein